MRCIIKLNCDLGEGFNTVDEAVMPYIDMANIACGGHAGDQDSMLNAVTLAQKFHVEIGAHPSYPDKKNFGRQPFPISSHDLIRSLHTQIDDLIFICTKEHTTISYIKPHGQLYHDGIMDLQTRTSLLEIAQHYNLPLMMMATTDNTSLINHAQGYCVPIIFEAFADRSYTENGHLVARHYAHAVHKDNQHIQQQAQTLIDKHGVFSSNGAWLPLAAQSICVHGDNRHAMEAIKIIRALLKNKLGTL